jgi:hemoglobin
MHKWHIRCRSALNHQKKTKNSIERSKIMKKLSSFIKPITLAIVMASFLAPIAGQTATRTNKSLYDRLGGIFAIAAVVNHFSDAVVENPIVGKNSKNPYLRNWHTRNLGRLPGLKFMRTLWVASAAGGPYQYTPTKPGKTNLGLEEAHRNLRISPDEFDEVAAELSRSLDFAKVPLREKKEVLAAFAAHKAEVTAGYTDGRRGHSDEE